MKAYSFTPQNNFPKTKNKPEQILLEKFLKAYKKNIRKIHSKSLKTKVLLSSEFIIFSKSLKFFSASRKTFLQAENESAKFLLISKPFNLSGLISLHPKTKAFTYHLKKFSKRSNEADRFSLVRFGRAPTIFIASVISL